MTMKLESLDSYRKDTWNFKVFATVIVCISIVSNILMYYLSSQRIEKAYSKIWVVDKDFKPYLADSKRSFDYPERVFEYEQTVREFYRDAFSMDDTDFKSNLERALNLSVEFVNGQTIEDKWSEENIISNVVENNWRYEAMCDSVLFDLESKPVKGYAFGKQTIKMRRQTVVRNMNFTFIIYDVERRTRKNPFAAKIDHIDIFNNAVIANQRD
jgi:hypothetical protein